MTRDQMLADLYSRLTSRKLWLCLLAIGFAALNYHSGALSAVEFQQAVTAAVVAYLAVEGVSDAAAALGKPQANSPQASPATPTAAPTAAELADELETRRAERIEARLRALAGGPVPPIDGGARS